MMPFTMRRSPLGYITLPNRAQYYNSTIHGCFLISRAQYSQPRDSQGFTIIFLSVSDSQYYTDIAGLLKTLNPDWSHAAIRSALVPAGVGRKV
ncbi:26S proteasome non-ATPase regulatory subunit 1-like protein A-like [Iris pallida]|uniref:26S proteasome non-ATPase regulatory subunit 1-like protein A-like n=1 Tax=Iris pallida TaxID=29817 RepID=A0AAX6HBC8_IRIPA|nr:26S proteasome non-ATPase regulatory subunit 1-like protein A-like [Iris pallida]